MFTTSYTYITWIHRIAMNSTTIHHILSHGVPLHLFAMWFEVLVVIVLNIIILLFEELLVICAALEKCFPVGFCPAWPLPIRFPENGNAYTHMYIYIYIHTCESVCVWTIWTDVKLLPWLAELFFLIRFFAMSILPGVYPISFSFAGGGSRVQSLPPTKTLWFPWWYMAWSAMRTCISNFRQWRPAKPSTGMSFLNLFKPNNCTVFAIWLSCIRTGKSFKQGRRKISCAQFLTSNHLTFPVRFYWSVFARVMHSTSVIR